MCNVRQHVTPIQMLSHEPPCESQSDCNSL